MAAKGRGRAGWHGWLSSNAEDAEVVGFWDADLATPLENHLRTLLHELERVPPSRMVLGSRVRLLGRAVHPQGHSPLSGARLATTASMLLRPAIYEPSAEPSSSASRPQLKPFLAEPFLLSLGLTMWNCSPAISSKNKTTPAASHDHLRIPAEALGRRSRLQGSSRQTSSRLRRRTQDFTDSTCATGNSF